MCGIFGHLQWRGDGPPIEHLKRATNLLRHRGPDAGAYFAEGPAFLGHRRLAIIDLRPCGCQPMFSASGRHVISFNGEIYNYIELRQELIGRGHRFVTDSDTEVILAGYDEWGPAVASRLLGMFALAIYDREDESVYLARDRIGEKPLLVWSTAHTLSFASELAPLTTLPGRPREIDPEALGGFLTLNYVPGDTTMLAGVRRVPPGSWQQYTAAGLERTQRYWSPDTAPDPPHTLDEAGDRLQEALDRSIAMALRSDVPVGLFLSGGVDSSLVAESAARQGRLQHAFCVDMADSGFSEWPAASRVAQQLGVPLTRVPFSAAVLDRFVDVVHHADDPLADSSAVAVWTVARAASDTLKVVLGGDGGDELFAGYLTYAASRWHASVASWIPAPAARMAAVLAGAIPANDRRKVSASYKLQRFLRGLTLPPGEAHFSWNGTWLPEEAAGLAATPAISEAARRSLSELAARHRLGARASLDALQRADLAEYLPNDILAKVDRMTMAHGVESRAPLLHPEIVALALSLPESMRTARAGRTKVLLRHLCARHFGKLHADAPKQGFSIPIHTWLRGPARALATSLLAPERVAATGVLDAMTVRRAVDAHVSGRRALGWELWGLMVFVAWYEARVQSPPDVARMPPADDLVPLATPSRV